MVYAKMQAATFPIETDSIVWPVSVLALQDSVRERSKEAPDGSGRPTYATGAMIRIKSKDGSIRLDRVSSVNVIEKPTEPFEVAAIYQSEGAVCVQPYQNDSGKMIYSITVEKLVKS